MDKKAYPSYSATFILLLVLLLAGFAGLPAFFVYLVWKNALTFNIAQICSYIAAFTITIRYAKGKMAESGDVFSVRSQLNQTINIRLTGILIVLTVAIGICIDYFNRALQLKNWLETDIAGLMKIPSLAFLSMVILPAFLEEFLFRGIILKQFLKRYSIPASIIASAFFFGTIHGNPPQMVAGFTAGCFLGWVYFKTKNIWYCILIHFVNNSVAWIEYQLPQQSTTNGLIKFMNGLDTNSTAFIAALIISITGIFLLNRKSVPKTSSL